jgi:hypothetical protein
MKLKNYSNTYLLKIINKQFTNKEDNDDSEDN